MHRNVLPVWLQIQNNPHVHRPSVLGCFWFQNNLSISSQIKSHNRANNDHNEERQPRLDEPTDPDVLATDEHPGCQVDHVVVQLLLVSHELQSSADMGMAIVAEEIMHPRPVKDTCLGHCLVPLMGPSFHEHWVQWQVAGRPSKAHIVLRDVIWSGEISNYSAGHGDSWKKEGLRGFLSRWNVIPMCPMKGKNHVSTGIGVQTMQKGYLWELKFIIAMASPESGLERDIEMSD